MFNCPPHPDTVIISDPVGVGKEMSPGMSGAAGIWSALSRTDDTEEAGDKIQSVLTDATSEPRRQRSVDTDVGAWSRLLAGSSTVSTVTEEVFFAI